LPTAERPFNPIEICPVAIGNPFRIAWITMAHLTRGGAALAPGFVRARLRREGRGALGRRAEGKGGAGVNGYATNPEWTRLVHFSRG